MGRDEFKFQRWDYDESGEETVFTEQTFYSLEEAEEYYTNNPAPLGSDTTIVYTDSQKTSTYKHSKIEADLEDIKRSELSDEFFNAYSLLFDGINSGIDFGDNYDFDIGDEYSLSFWIKAKKHDLNIEGVIGKKDDDKGNGWAACVLPDNKICWSSRGVSGNPGNAATIISKQPIEIEKWNHLVFTKSKGTAAETMTIYCNGEVVPYDIAQDNNAGTSITNVPLRVAISSTNKFGFKGNLTQMFISDKVITLDEVIELYGKGRPKNLTKFSGFSKIKSWWKIGQKYKLPTIKDSVSNIHGIALNIDEFNTDIPQGK